ncbi:MAG: GUN4 domain-containing protein, partial [Trichodesmium sp. St16_bin2-tuft]|nr:GUN4 domain-containing protein [Trichodesmium sp. St16_bin2-tuft]
GNFGFSVQKQIYQSVGGTMEYDSKVWIKFANKVGWRKGGQWLDYSELTFSKEHYRGHLPLIRECVGLVIFDFVGERFGGGDFPSLVWRPVDCNI